jgi:signal peptidase II
VISLVAVFVIGRLWLQTDPADRVKGLGLVLILGGALGNLHDRVRTLFDPETYHGVRDFILFPNIVFGDPFPTFNLADAWITIGVVLVAWTILFEGKPLEEQATSGAATPGTHADQVRA